jgi:hypothetical protein
MGSMKIVVLETGVATDAHGQFYVLDAHCSFGGMNPLRGVNLEE